LKGLNILLLGNDNLSNFGINKKQLQLLILISTAILTGVVTAFCGPIGFVGIVVPHFSRILIKTSNHIKLLPVTALLGASLMLLSDILTQLPQNGIILPINSVTAFIGIPFILWFLLKPSRKIKI
jgi:iron complex transport system permease protein